MPGISVYYLLFLISMAFGGATPLTAQSAAPRTPDGVVSGRVVDAESAGPIPGASVTLEPRALGAFPAPGPASDSFIRGTRSVRTDTAGGYRFDEVPPGDYRLHVQRAGYQSASVEVAFRGSGDSRVSVGLRVEPVALQPLVIRSGPAVASGASYGRTVDADARGETEGEHRIAVEEMRQREHLPSDVRAITHADVEEGITLGETDLFRALQRLPGVSTRDEFSAELWTRGAPWDQTRVLFDGLPLFSPLHAMGVFSGVNSDAVGAAFFHPGVQPVSLSGGAAGMLDLRSRKGGGGDGTRGMGELSLVSSRLALDGTMGDGKHAWMIAGRRSYVDLLARVADRFIDDDTRLPYKFWDFTSRYDYRISEQTTLELSAMQELDEITGDLPDILHRTSAHWGGGAGRATLQTPLFGLRSRHTVGFSGFGSMVQRREADPELDSIYSAPQGDAATNQVWYYALGGDVEPQGPPSSPSTWSGGYQFVGQRVSYAGPSPTQYQHPAIVQYGFYRDAALAYGAVWGERRWSASDRVQIEGGLRVEAGTPVRNGGAVRLAPRLSARYRFPSSLSLSAAVGRTFQYTQALAPAGLLAIPGFRTESLWLLAGDSVPAIRSDVATIGAERWIGDRWLGGINAFVRRSSGVAIPDPTPGSTVTRPLFVTSENHARGVEVSARRLTGRWTASMAYSYGISEMEADGLRFPAAADQRHVFDATALLRLGWGWQLGAAYTRASGMPYTRTFDGVADCTSGMQCVWSEEPWIGEPGARRMEGYQSLDLLAEWNHAFRSWGIGAYVQVRNALNHPNPGRYTGFDPRYCAFSCGTRNGVEFGYEERDRFLPGLPTIPVIGFRASF